MRFYIATTPFLRRLYSLQKLLQRRSEPELLGTACADVCLAIENLLPPSIPPKRARTTNSNKSTVQQPQHPKLSEILVAVDRCHPFILQAFAKVSGNGQEKGASGLIVYYYVRLFQSLLSYLHQHALSKSRWLLNKKKSSGKKSRQVTQSNTANAQVYSSVQLSREDNKIMDSVSRTLAKLILAIDVRKRAHYSLLEGVLCVLLNHIGNVLSMLVFKELRSNPSLRTCPSKLPVPSSNSDETMNRTGVSVAETAAMLQTSYLVWILERAMLTVDHPCCAHESGTGNSNDISTHSFTDVLGDAKRRLQNTLLKGVFGLNDPEFQESLNPPKEVSGSSFTERTAGNVELSNNENQDPGGWFVGEIWRLLGWDSLMDGQEC